MKVKDLKKVAEFTFVNEASEDKDITGVTIGDLLSFVMAKGSQGHLWVTVQAHQNVIAVSLLKEFSAIIVCDDATFEEGFIDKCKEEDIDLIHTSLSAYEVAKILVKLGL